jgi:hypothetical protein
MPLFVLVPVSVLFPFPPIVLHLPVWDMLTTTVRMAIVRRQGIKYIGNPVAFYRSPRPVVTPRTIPVVLIRAIPVALIKQDVYISIRDSIHIRSRYINYGRWCLEFKDRQRHIYSYTHVDPGSAGLRKQDGTDKNHHENKQGKAAFFHKTSFLYFSIQIFSILPYSDGHIPLYDKDHKK